MVAQNTFHIFSKPNVLEPLKCVCITLVMSSIPLCVCRFATMDIVWQAFFRWQILSPKGDKLQIEYVRAVFF